MTDTTKQKIEIWQTRFDALSGREKGLTLLAGLAIIIMLGFVLFIEPILIKQERLEKEITRQSNQLSAFNQQVAELEREVLADPNIELRDRLESLKAETARMDQLLLAETNDLVPAHRMADLLKSILSGSRAVRLMEMASIPPRQLLAAQDAAIASHDNLYQHGIRLTLQGSYFTIQAYMEQIERLPSRLYWKKFDYRVIDYPLAEVDIELYTLSTNQAFIGVSDYE